MLFEPKPLYHPEYRLLGELDSHKLFTEMGILLQCFQLFHKSLINFTNEILFQGLFNY